MKKLTQSAFQRAKNFIMDHGRVLDQRRFEFHFEDGPSDAVLAALTPYQNDDGGFAHSLEPDIRTPFSSAIVTTVGFQILREIQAPASHILVRKGIQYFITTYEESQQVWHIVPPEVDDALTRLGGIMRIVPKLSASFWSTPALRLSDIYMNLAMACRRNC
ncbi:MAG: hypothetical protein OYL97_19875 [Candidatus Poribacteria bacterium]|nr:hypothetical protein [Candidatus Poribacteria bacterium]